MADPHSVEVDAKTGQATTGHAWDGIKELNTPLPRWWLYIFYATIIWAFGYWIAYPAFPLIASHTTGLLGYSSRAEVAREMDQLRTLRGANAAAIATTELPAIVANPTLLAFAMAQGRAAFGDNCAPCHGSNAIGSRGYPNLRDDNWLWGGDLANIHQTIQFGIRNGDDRARQGVMMGFGGANALLRREEIVMVANHVRALAGLPTRNGVDLAKGRELFAANCASCHGDEGRGNQDLGAPNLTQRAAWLYGSDEATIIETITLGRGGVMPGWETRLDAATVKALAVYVHTLGGGR